MNDRLILFIEKWRKKRNNFAQATQGTPCYYEASVISDMLTELELILSIEKEKK